MKFLSDAKNLLIAAFVSLLIGFAAGFITKGKFVKADQVTAIVEVRKDDAKAITTNLASDVATLNAEQKNNSKAQRITRAISVTVPTGGLRAPSNETACPSNPLLSVGLVRLLNDARSGSVVESAERADAAEQTASDVTVSDFAENDVEVTRLYHELAGRHDKLVDWVEAEILKQQK